MYGEMRHITDSQMARIPLGIEVSFLKTPEVAKLREKRLVMTVLLSSEPYRKTTYII